MRRIMLVLLLTSTITTTGIVLYKQRKPEQPAPVASKTERPGASPLPKVAERKPTFDEAVASITEAELKKNLYYFASPELEGRMSGKRGNVTAAEFIYRHYKGCKLPVMYAPFAIQRVNPGPKNEQGDSTTQNIYAWIAGSDPVLKNEVVIVGAHMDHIGYGPQYSRAPRRREVHPGADDNASGTVALLEIAQAFSMLPPPKRTVVFQSYSAEEMGLIGSRHYCDRPLFPIDETIRSEDKMRKHVAMINMDMIGYLGKGYHFAGFSEGDSSVDLGQIINDLNGKYSFAKSITSRGTGGSDHASFYNKRVPVAFLNTGLHDYYHTPDDTPDKINYKGIEQVARYAFELAYRVANAETTPRFNHRAFKAMSYDHDHGFGHYHSHDKGVTHDH